MGVYSAELVFHVSLVRWLANVPLDVQRKVTHTHTRITALCPGVPGWAGTRKVIPTRILLKQETVSGSGISRAICKSATCSRQTTTPAPHHSVFTDRTTFLPPSQQRQSAEGTEWKVTTYNKCGNTHTKTLCHSMKARNSSVVWLKAHL